MIGHLYTLLLVKKNTTEPPKNEQAGGGGSGGPRRRVEFADLEDDQVRHSNEVAIAFVMALAISGEF